MPKRYPKSFLRLVLLGFGVVSAPLLLAIAYAVLSFQHWAHDSEMAVRRASGAAQASRQLTDSLLAMERTLRQYAVLGDSSLLDDYQRLRGTFRASAADLAGMALTAEAQTRLGALMQREADFSARLAATARDAPEGLIQAFQALADEALPVVDAARGVASSEVSRLQSAASAARNAIWLPVVAAFAAAFGLAWWFRNRIAAQMKQIDRAIRALGKADYDDPITVIGPDDVAFLGSRLDWLRQRLAELETHQIRFLRHVSHDLKTPLTALREGAQLLADEVTGPLTAQQRQVVAIMTQSSLRLQSLIENLLNFQQASMAARNLDLQRVSLTRVIGEVLEGQRLAARARGVKFDRALAPVTMTGDTEKLRAVVENLVANAVKFSPPNGRVRVALSVEDSGAVIDIQDQGPGIPEGEREQIFEAFFRGTRSGENSVEGNGLGLAIAREYVAAHDGRIALVSPPGEGAHFRVTLPLASKAVMA